MVVDGFLRIGGRHAVKSEEIDMIAKKYDEEVVNAVLRAFKKNYLQEYLENYQDGLDILFEYILLKITEMKEEDDFSDEMENVIAMIAEECVSYWSAFASRGGEPDWTGGVTRGMDFGGVGRYHRKKYDIFISLLKEINNFSELKKHVLQILTYEDIEDGITQLADKNN